MLYTIHQYIYSVNFALSHYLKFVSSDKNIVAKQLYTICNNVFYIKHLFRFIDNRLKVMYHQKMKDSVRKVLEEHNIELFMHWHLNCVTWLQIRGVWSNVYFNHMERFARKSEDFKNRYRLLRQYHITISLWYNNVT